MGNKTDQTPIARPFQFKGRIRSFRHRDAKDVAAGAVLITAMAAAVIGAIVFWPYLRKFAE